MREGTGGQATTPRPTHAFAEEAAPASSMPATVISIASMAVRRSYSGSVKTSATLCPSMRPRKPRGSRKLTKLLSLSAFSFTVMAIP